MTGFVAGRSGRSPARLRRRGFTLLEALVALVLAGVITGGVALALRTGLDAADRIQERSDAHSEARAALETLSADLSAAYLSGVNREQTLFRGDPPEVAGADQPFLTFTTLSYRRHGGASAEGEPRSDAVKVEYSLETPQGAQDLEGGAALVRTERWLTESGPGVKETICERVAGLQLRYGDGDDLRDSWSAAPEANPKLKIVIDEDQPSRASRRKLPKVVEILLRIAPKDRETGNPRMYKTRVALRQDGIAPFETEVQFPPPPNQPAGGAKRAIPHAGPARSGGLR